MPFKKSGQYRSFSGEIKLLEKKGEFLFSTEIWLLNDKVNRNNWRYTDMAGNMAQFAGTPVLVAYVNNGRTVGDGHNMRIETDPVTGEQTASFLEATAERIVGAISEDINDIRLEVRDGNTWIVAKASLWRWYAKELVEKIERDAKQGRSMSISIETLVIKSHMEGDVEVEDEYKILGTTILGDHVMPAVADAHIAALAAKEGFQELKIRAASYIQGAGEPANTKPQNVKKGLNTLNIFNKPQLEKLQERFSGYVVLSACRDDHGVHVALRNDKWELFSYDMENEADTVAPEKINSCAASVTFGNGCTVDAFEMASAVVSELNRANAALDAANKTITERDGTIESMRKAENARRLSAAKDKASSTLAAFNAARADKIAEDVLTKINADIDAGIYTNSVDANGVWNGDTAVENAVYAVCARKIQEMDADAQKRSATTQVWNRGADGGAQHDNGTVEALLAKKGIR